MTEILLDGEPVARFILAGEPESPAHLHLPADRAGERGALRGADSLDAGQHDAERPQVSRVPSLAVNVERWLPEHIGHIRPGRPDCPNRHGRMRNHPRLVSAFELQRVVGGESRLRRLAEPGFNETAAGYLAITALKRRSKSAISTPWYPRPARK